MVRKLQASQVAYAEGLGQVAALATEYAGELALFLFGSYATGQATPLSDLDLAYFSLKSLSEQGMHELDITLYRRLSHILASDDFSLINLREAPPTLAFAVLSQGRLLAASDYPGLQAFRERIFALYPESRHLKQTYLQAAVYRLLQVGEPAEAVPAKENRMSINHEKILEQLHRLDLDLRKLESKMQLTETAYLADSDSQDVVERRLQTACEACLNIGNHLIAALGLQPAEEYAAIFQSLAAGSVLSQTVADSMADMARFRNLLVHLYWRIDPRQVYQSLPQRVAALRACAQEIITYLGLDK
ncbi:MAG: DUF86 domain-containing protein [Chloroflexi bacterium]|nr:DUF86 domain-containing protein [Chloroflexota bacterium]